MQDVAVDSLTVRLFSDAGFFEIHETKFNFGLLKASARQDSSLKQ